jgi:hypothetical protein
LSNNSLPTKKILGLLEIEEQVFTGFIATHNLRNVTYFLRDTLTYNTPQSDFSSMNVGIIGENILGQLIVFFPVQHIEIFTLDSNIFFSKGYSENMIFEGDSESEFPLKK